MENSIKYQAMNFIKNGLISIKFTADILLSYSTLLFSYKFLILSAAEE